jgi:Protein of unknown function, DUF547
MFTPLFNRRHVMFLALPLSSLPTYGRAVATFDHSHAAWTTLLGKHVQLMPGRQASSLRYAAIAAERPVLQAYLAALSAVDAPSFATFSKPEQMAFLINAYNAFTVELILTRYPKLASIKELGSFVQSPWKKKFVPLLDELVSLDHIEHERLRARGRYDDWRIHFALNCASVGCPMLREEAFVADRLDAQLDEQVQRFLSDRSRNRWNAETRTLDVSKIFDWYGEDFRQGHKGVDSLPALFARFADRLADASPARLLIREQKVPIAFLDYDWRLNDVGR